MPPSYSIKQSSEIVVYEECGIYHHTPDTRPTRRVDRPCALLEHAIRAIAERSYVYTCRKAQTRPGSEKWKSHMGL